MTMEEVAREALGLSQDERLSLARLLIESAEVAPQAETEAAWEAEIEARARAVREGRVQGIPYEDVLARVDRRLSS